MNEHLFVKKSFKYGKGPSSIFPQAKQNLILDRMQVNRIYAWAGRGLCECEGEGERTPSFMFEGKIYLCPPLLSVFGRKISYSEFLSHSDAKEGKEKISFQRIAGIYIKIAFMNSYEGCRIWCKTGTYNNLNSKDGHRNKEPPTLILTAWSSKSSLSLLFYLCARYFFCVCVCL